MSRSPFVIGDLDGFTPELGRLVGMYFKWLHVFEDELNHRGQIRWLVKRLS